MNQQGRALSSIAPIHPVRKSMGWGQVHDRCDLCERYWQKDDCGHFSRRKRVRACRAQCSILFECINSLRIGSAQSMMWACGSPETCAGQLGRIASLMAGSATRQWQWRARNRRTARRGCEGPVVSRRSRNKVRRQRFAAAEPACHATAFRKSPAKSQPSRDSSAVSVRAASESGTMSP